MALLKDENLTTYSTFKKEIDNGKSTSITFFIPESLNSLIDDYVLYHNKVYKKKITKRDAVLQLLCLSESQLKDAISSISKTIISLNIP